MLAELQAGWHCRAAGKGIIGLAGDSQDDDRRISLDRAGI
jgi:hypothetical protein